jgi:hypothetical protein
MSGYVNKQNCWFFTANNPLELHQRPLHECKSDNVVCSFFWWHYWSVFFEDKEGQTVTVNAERYMAMLEEFMRNELNPRQLNSPWFQQDGETAHSARISMAVLTDMFPGRLISRFGDINLPTRLPDLLAPDYFLWGYVKSKV